MIRQAAAHLLEGLSIANITKNGPFLIPWVVKRRGGEMYLGLARFY